MKFSLWKPSFASISLFMRAEIFICESPLNSMFCKQCTTTTTTTAMRWRKEHSHREFIKTICLTLMQRNTSTWDSIFNRNNLPSRLTPHLVDEILLKTKKDANASLAFFNWAAKQRGFKHTLYSTSIVIHTLFMAGLLNPAKTLIHQNSGHAPALFETLLRTLRVCSSKPLVFDLLMMTYSQERMIPEAVITFFRIRDCGFKPSLEACNEVLCTLWKMNLVEMAWKFYWAMVQNGISPDEYTFSILVQMLCKEGRVADSVQMLDEMKEKGGAVGVALYNVIVDAHCREGKVQKGLTLVQTMFDKGLIPDFVTYSSILNGLCMLGRSEEANQLFDEMICKKFAHISDVAMQYGPLEKAEAALGGAPDFLTYSAFVIELCRLVKMDAAEMVFKKIIRKGWTVNGSIYNAMLDGFSKEGRMKEALQMYNEMLQQNFLVNSSSCKVIINGLCMEDRVSEAREIFSTMLERGTVPESSDFSVLIAAYCKEGNLDVANELFHDMLQRGLIPSTNTCCILVKQYCKEGCIDEALCMFEKLTESDNFLDGVTYNALLLGLCQKQHMQEADKVFSFVQSKGLALSTISYTTMIRGHCKAGNFREALKLHDEMLQKDLKPDHATYKDLIAGFDI